MPWRPYGSRADGGARGRTGERTGERTVGPTAGRGGEQEGSAVVDFVLVLVVLVPLFLGILQLALVLHVRNTLTAAASEGARHAAMADRTPADGAAVARRQVAGVLAERFAQRVSVAPTTIDGAAAVEVTIAVEVPALGLWGPGVSLEVSGHAIEEPE